MDPDTLDSPSPSFTHVVYTSRRFLRKQYTTYFNVRLRVYPLFVYRFVWSVNSTYSNNYMKAECTFLQTIHYTYINPRVHDF